MTIDDRLRAAASELRNEPKGAVPDLPEPKLGIGALGTWTLVAILVGGGLWALNSQVDGSPDTLVAGDPVGSAALPAVSIDTSSNVDTSVRTTIGSPKTATRLDESDFWNWVGPWQIEPQVAIEQLGSTGHFSYRVEMTESSFCFRTEPGGGGCALAADGAALSPDPREPQYGNSSETNGGWTRFYLVPADVELQHVGPDGAACVLQRFSLEQYGNAAVFACEGTGDVPPQMDVEARRNGEIVETTIDPYSFPTPPT